MAGEQAQYLHQNGAGYTINKKAWQDASVTGLKRKLLARLKLFGRPVDAAMLAERVANQQGEEIYTDTEIQSALNVIVSEGAVAEESGLYSLM